MDLWEIHAKTLEKETQKKDSPRGQEEEQDANEKGEMHSLIKVMAKILMGVDITEIYSPERCRFRSDLEKTGGPHSGWLPAEP